MAEKLTDEQKQALQAAADDPNSGINRDQATRANQIQWNAENGFAARQWSVDRAVQVACTPTFHGSLQPRQNPVTATVELAQAIFDFIRTRPEQ